MLCRAAVCCLLLYVDACVPGTHWANAHFAFSMLAGGFKACVATDLPELVASTCQVLQAASILAYITAANAGQVGMA